MPYFGVTSGDINTSVEADTHLAAAVLAVVERIEEHGSARPGVIFTVLQVGDDEDDEMIMLAEVVAREGGFILSDS